MLTVEADPVSVERRLRSGGLACPGCGGVLAPWSWSTPRVVRDEGSSRLPLRPRRAWCSQGCGATHVLLLPVVVLLRRADTVEVIGVALRAAAGGMGARRVAGLVGRAPSTVRGWLGRFAGRAQAVRVRFVGLLVEVGVDAVVPAPAGSAVGDAVAAVAGAVVAVAARWPLVGVVSPWRGASAATNGGLLSPSPSWMITAVP
jgi:hypothetical protein